MKGDVKEKLLLDRRSGCFFLTASPTVLNYLAAMDRALILLRLGQLAFYVVPLPILYLD